MKRKVLPPQHTLAPAWWETAANIMFFAVGLMLIALSLALNH